MPRPLLPLVLLLVVGAMAGCGGSSTGGRGGGSARATATAGAQTDNGCRRVSRPAPKGDGHLAKPHTTLSSAKTWVATVSTSCGSFAITLDVKDSPRTTGSFAYLARKRFYDGTTFHRVVPGFVIQGGDPKGDGTGGPGYSIAEPPPHGVRYPVGSVAMAKTQFDPAGTSGSQFFVVVGDSSSLTPEYALLGKVTSGMDAVKRIAAADVANQETGAPKDPIVIDSVRVAPH